MSLPPYPHYHDNDSRWLGPLPAGWNLVPLKAVVANIESGVSVNADDRPAGAGELGVLKTSCVYTGAFDISQNKAVVAADLARVACPVRQGSLIVSRMNTPDLVGAAGLVLDAQPNIFLPDRLWQVTLKDTVPAFAHYWSASQAYRGQVQAACSGTSSSMQNLSQGQFLSFDFPLASIAEQRAIAAFLDRECGKIDGLVAEQERLIALLKEKRQAVISQAVTKGLDPAAPMKDSGIEWLGQVPAHWKVGKCGFYLSILAGFAFPSGGFSEDPSHTRLLRGINVGVSAVRWSETVYWERHADDELDRYCLRAGDLVVGMDRPWITDGVRVAKLGPDDVPALLLQRVARLTPLADLNGDYLHRLLASKFFVAHFSPDMTGVSVPHISPEQIADFVIPIPPVLEQQEIVRHVTAETTKLDTLTAEAERAIALLKERRAALISAAVTGKIDVRGLVAPAAAEAA